MRVVSVLLSCITVVIAQDQCRTANGNTGTCILLDDCEPIVKINQIKKKTAEDVAFLKQSHCGLFMSLKPKVCCPHKSLWQNFSTIKPFTFPPFKKSTSTTSSTTRAATTYSTTTTTNAPININIDLFATPAFDDDLTCKPTIAPPKPETFCCGIEVYNGERIIGGKTAAPDQFPWLALLEYNGTDRKTACGASLISARYVLTAAHCLGNTKWGYAYKVHLSEYNTSSYPTDLIEVNGGGFENVANVFIAVEAQIAHPGYVRYKEPVLDDIGLIKLTSNAPYNDFLRPICLPSVDVYPTDDSDVNFYAAGWGSDGFKVSIIKKYIKLPSFPLSKCKEVFSRVNKPVLIYDTHICAGGEKDKDTCAGDSGGPLMYLAGDTWIVAGIVSFGDAVCGKEGKPGVYTHVYKYLDWITERMV